MGVQPLVLPEVRIEGRRPTAAPDDATTAAQARLSNRAGALLRAAGAAPTASTGGFEAIRTAQDDAELRTAGTPPPPRTDAVAEAAQAASGAADESAAPVASTGGFETSRTTQDDAEVAAAAPERAPAGPAPHETPDGAPTAVAAPVSETPVASDAGFATERTAQDDSEVSAARTSAAVDAGGAPDAVTVSASGPDPSGIRTPGDLVTGVRAAAGSLTVAATDTPLAGRVAPTVASARARAAARAGGGGGPAPRPRPVDPITIDPVPKATAVVAAALTATLPELALPALTQPPPGHPAATLDAARLPRTGTGELKPVAPPAPPPAVTGATVTQAEKKRRAHAATTAAAPVTVTPEPPRPIDPPVLLDVRRPPQPPLPRLDAELQKQQIARVLGVIAATVEDRATGTVQAIRDNAFADGRMGDLFTEVTNPWKNEIATAHRATLTTLAEAAGMSARDLDDAVAARKRDLAATLARRTTAAELDAQAAAEALTDEAKKEQARADQEARRQQARRVQRLRLAMHSHDPALVDELVTARLDFLGKDVASGVVAIDAAGARRAELLTAYENAYVDAYRRAGDAALRAAEAADTGSWADPDPAPATPWATTAQEGARTAFTALRTATTTATTTLVSGLTAAAETARAALREWREARLARVTHGERADLAATRDHENVLAQIATARAEAAKNATRAQLSAEIAFVGRAYLQKQEQTGAAQAEGAARLDTEQMKLADRYLAAGQGDPIVGVAEVMAGRQRDDQVAERGPKLRAQLLGMVPASKQQALDLADVYFDGGNGGLTGRMTALKKAFDGPGTDEAEVLAQLAGIAGPQMALLNTAYGLFKGENLQERIDDEMDGSDEDQALGLARDDGGPGSTAARQQHARGVIADSNGIFSNDPQRALDAIRALPPGEADAVANDPATKKHLQVVLAGDRFDYGKRAWVEDTRGQAQLDALLTVNRFVRQPGEPRPAALRIAQSRADAIEMDRHIRRGTAGDPPDVDKLFARIRADVIADPFSAGWSAEEVDHEVRRRTMDMERAYQDEFGGEMPEAANAMRTAMGRYLWGTNKQLATDLLDVNRAGERATRLQRTTEGVYTSDSEMNTELARTYNDALAEVRRSRAKQDEVAAEVETLLTRDGYGPDHKPGPRELAAYRREATENIARSLAQTWFREVDTTFGKRYAAQWGGNPSTALTEMVTDTTQFGGEREALDRLKGGGGLTAAQRVRHGVEGWGIEKDEVMGGIGGRTVKQLDRIRAEYQDSYHEDMDARLRSETGDWETTDADTTLERDAFDIKEALLGVAVTPEDEKAAADRRLHYEESVYFANDPGGRELAVGAELADMRTAHARLTAAHSRCQAALSSGDATAISNSAASMRFARDSVDLAADHYRSAVDAYTERLAQIAAIAAAIVVTIVTWGAAGPVVIALMASVAGTVASMAAKQSVLGAAYSRHALTNDLIVGIVDAIVTVATARLGNVLLRLPKPTGTGKVLQASLKAIEAQRLAKPVLARMGAFAAEQVAQAAPSAVTGALLDRNIWKGDPVKNVGKVAGFASAVGIGVGGVMHGVTSYGSKIFGQAIEKLQRGTLADISAERVLLRSTADALANGQVVGDVLAHQGTPAERLAARREYLRRFPDRTPADFAVALREGTADAVGSADAQRALRREMLAELLGGVPPAERARLRDTPILVLSDVEFRTATGSTSNGRAATLVLHGEPVVVIRDGAPLSALREEGMHAVQIRDQVHAQRVALLDEQRLARWSSMSLEERTLAWQAKLDLELEVQARLVGDLDERLGRGGLSAEQRAALRTQLDDAHAALDILGQRRVTLDALDDAARAKIRSGAAEPPPFLADEPRLFNKAKAPPDASVPMPGQPGVEIVPPVGKVIGEETVAADGRRMRWVREWDPGAGAFRHYEQVYNPKSKRWNLHGDSPRWSGMVGETAMKLEHGRLVGVGPDGVKRVQIDAQNPSGHAFDDVMPEFRAKPGGGVDAEIVVYESKYYRNRVGTFSAIDENFAQNLGLLKQRLEGIRDSGGWEAAGMTRAELDAALRAVDSGKVRVVVRTAETTKIGATALGEIEARLRKTHGNRVTVERGATIAADSLAEAEELWMQMERYRLGGYPDMTNAEAQLVERLATRANGVSQSSIDTAEVVLLAQRRSGSFVGADVAWDPTGAFLVSGGQPMQVITPRRPGPGRLDPDAVARQILAAAGTTVTPSGAAAAVPLRVVIDAGLLNLGEIRALQQALKRQSKGRGGAAALGRMMMVAVPDGVPATVTP